MPTRFHRLCQGASLSWRLGKEDGSTPWGMILSRGWTALSTKHRNPWIQECRAVGTGARPAQEGGEHPQHPAPKILQKSTLITLVDNTDNTEPVSRGCPGCLCSAFPAVFPRSGSIKMCKSSFISTCSPGCRDNFLGSLPLPLF